MNSYPIQIGNVEYMVEGLGDLLDSPPSARGFVLNFYEPVLKEYATVYKATEENGYGFILYSDGETELILKGSLGSDHTESILAKSKELKDIRVKNYPKQNNIEFLRKTCLSGRSWLVTLNNVNYYFVAIWNSTITQFQYQTLTKYLKKFPKQYTYIQMGLLGTAPSSKFTLVSQFVPRFSIEKRKLTDKEKEFIKTAHMRTPELPAGYAKELEKLRTMTENKDYESYKNYALKLISKLEKIKQLGKTKTPAKDIVTKSSADSVLIGLGNNFPELKTKLSSLLKYAFKSADLVNLHQKGKLDVKNWSDDSLRELTKKQWEKSMSTGVGDKDHPINNDVKHHVGKLKVKFENAEMAQSDVTKLIDYSEKLQSMFDVNDNLEDWVKAKLNHACDYVATVRDYLKFYRDEKEAGTPENQIDEKWTNKYKKTINCRNPKGFSQKAHCRARKLRQAGKHTKSKPVREIYKEITSQLLKEFNSSMAMGALKQINSDAKELESMLQPNTQLEDWVKAKLNLAGEYLDDVYHHLDHFGTSGRTLDESGYYKKYWFTPTGKVVDAGNSHEEWIKNNDRALQGATLVDTYENAVAKGYVRGIFDIQSEFLTLSNLPNYDFLTSKLRKETKGAIEDFIINRNIKIVATGKGKLLKDFMFNMEPELAENLLESIKLKEGWKDWVAAGAVGLSALTGGNLQAAAPTANVPAITQTTQKSSSVINQSFVDYIKSVENAGKTGYDSKKKLWFPHESFEGGSDTIGYGHKIQPGENFSKGITDAQAEDLLKKDLEKAQSQVKKELGNRSLNQKQLEMFVDFVFNMGTLKKFPLFTQAVLKNDMDTMKAQYKRFAGGKELKGRNVSFLKRFLKEYFGFNYYF